MTMLALIEVPELFVETVLGLESDRNDGKRLSLTTSVQDKLGSCSVSVVPGGFDQKASGMDVPRLGDGSSALPFAG